MSERPTSDNKSSEAVDPLRPQVGNTPGPADEAMIDRGATEARTPETAGMLAVPPPVVIVSWDVPSPRALSEGGKADAWVRVGLATEMLSGLRARSGQVVDSLGRRMAHGARSLGAGAAAWRRRASGITTNGLQAARRGVGRLESGWLASTRRIAGLSTQVAAIRLPRPRLGAERVAELRSRFSPQVAQVGQTLSAISARRGLATATAALVLAFGAGFLTARWDSPNRRSPPPGGGVDRPRADIVQTSAVLASAPTEAVTMANRPDPMEVAHRLDASIYQGTVDGSGGSLRKASVTISPAPDRAASPRARSKSRTPRSSLACQHATTRAERMVCADPNLERADRDLKRAYDRAIAAGISAAGLQANHHDWLEEREDAARSSRREVAALYVARIDAVNHIADPPH